MGIAYEQTERIFQNARKFIFNTHRISDAPAVDELIRETGRLFSILQGEEDESAKTIRLNIWKLRASVIFALLPFDHDDLELMEQLSFIKTFPEYFPLLRESTERLSEIVNYLVKNPQNHKRGQVFQLLKESESGGDGVGIVAALTRGTTPGWSGCLVPEIQSIAPHSQMLMTRKILEKNTYRQIILSSSGRSCSFFYELLYGCRTARLDLVAYKGEGSLLPAKRSLPRGTVTTKAIQGIPKPLSPETSEPQGMQIDEWEKKLFWETIRGSAIDKPSCQGTEKDNHFLVKARLVLLADHTKVYLRDDTRIIEVSDIIDGHTGILGGHFPRKQVNQLREGDLVVLRTTGSGDYLIDVANFLMKADGQDKLCNSALDWKPVLKKALHEFGSEKIAHCLEEKGHIIRSHRYIWMWTTPVVIRPHSKELFCDLISILQEFDYDFGDNSAGFADSRWVMMQEIIHYHMMAGQRIRKLLLARLCHIIEQGIAITDRYHLTLSEVSAGELSICRVAGVDTLTLDIPYNRVGVIMKLGD